MLTTLLFFAEPATVAVEQLGAADTHEPIEQVGRRGASAFVEDASISNAPGGDVTQLSVSDNEISLARVDGIDRCSAELLSADQKAYCSRRIETRSAEFRSELTTPLTLEQKLIGERLVPLRGLENAARASAASPTNSDVQALASVTLAPTPVGLPDDAAKSAPGNLSTETQALVDALVSKLSNPGGQ